MAMPRPGGGSVTFSGDVDGTDAGPQFVIGLQGTPIAPEGPTDADVLTFTGGAWQGEPSASGPPSGAAGGDLGGTYPDPSVVVLQTVPVDATAPTTDDVLTFDGSEWSGAPSAGGPPSGAAGGDLAGASASVLADTAPTLPLTVVTGTNDTFIYTPAATGTPETFTVAAGTYTTAADSATAMGAAIGGSAEAFSTLVTPTV